MAFLEHKIITNILYLQLKKQKFICVHLSTRRIKIVAV